MKISFLATLGYAIVFITIIGMVMIYDGIFNVATAWEDPSLLHWALTTARENSIKNRATSIIVPATDGQQQIDSGFRHYRKMCAICHTPPGATDSPITRGLKPVPPDLVKSAKRMSAAELFWAIKNGIRMSGMPAWGPTHKDSELWDIVAFLKKLPAMQIDDYDSMDSRLEHRL